MSQNALPKLKDLSPAERGELADEILSKYEGGTTIAEAAESRRVSETSIYRLLLDERQEQWRNVRAARKLHELDEAVKKMRESKDHLELAQGEKLAARAAWELERLSKIYAPKQDQSPTIPVQININLRGEKVINEEPPLLNGTRAHQPLRP